MKESVDLSLKLNAIIMCFHAVCMCSRRDRATAKWLMINTKHPLYGSHRCCALYIMPILSPWIDLLITICNNAMEGEKKEISANALL